MKTTLSILLVLAALLPATALSQLRSQTLADESASASLVRPAATSAGFSSLFGLLSPDRFLMRHSLSMNYLSAGGQGLSIANYTNSMFYRIADPLDVRVDVTLEGSPFGPTAGMERQDMTRLYLSRAELNYRPWDNVFVQMSYREMPYGYFYSPYGLYSRGPFDQSWYGNPWGDR